jgi:hypothetical protein
MITCKEDFNGIAQTNCIECNEPVDFYLIMRERRAWMLAESIEMVTKRVT